MHPLLEKGQRLVDQLIVQSNNKNSDDILRLNHYIWLSIISIPLSLFFIVLNILSSNYNIAIAASTLLICMVSSLAAIPKIKNLIVLYHVNNCVFIALLILLSVWGDKNSGQILWCYMYPLLSIFLFGYKIGVKWSLFLLVAIIASLALSSGIELKYSEDFQIRFSIIYLTVLSIASWIEYSKSRYTETSRLQKKELEKERELLNDEIKQRTHLEGELKKLANQDGLTDMYNRRFFLSRTREELQRSQRYDIPLAMALIDLDDFKGVNDRYGHPAGDQILKNFAQQCKQFFRKSDICGRIGGEEFAVLLFHVSPEQAEQIMDRFRQKINNQTFYFEEQSLNISISIGIAVPDKEITDVDGLYATADKALYQAKHNGRNRVEFFT